VKTSFLDKLIGRIERVDPQSLQSYVLKLSREKGFLETLFNTIQEGIIVIDAEGRISYLNAAASQLLGIDPNHGIGEPVSRHLRDLDWQKIWSADKNEWRKVMSHELEVFYPRPRLLSFYIVPLVDEENSIVTGRKATRARARRILPPASQARQTPMSASHRYSKVHEPITAATGTMTWAIGGAYW
jgi:PAS domain-containing protein